MSGSPSYSWQPRFHAYVMTALPASLPCSRCLELHCWFVSSWRGFLLGTCLVWFRLWPLDHLCRRRCWLNCYLGVYLPVNEETISFLGLPQQNLKLQKLILSQPWKPAVKSGRAWSLWSSEGRSVLCLFWLLVAVRIPWLVAPCLSLWSHCLLFSCLSNRPGAHSCKDACHWI